MGVNGSILLDLYYSPKRNVIDVLSYSFVSGKQKGASKSMGNNPEAPLGKKVKIMFKNESEFITVRRYDQENRRF